MSFSNKTVIVTGGSSGIGAATAIHLAKQGADVAIIGRNEAKLNEVAEEINKHGKKALTLKAEVSNDDDLKKIVQKTVEKFGKIDVLVNNAGLTVYAEIEDKDFIQAYDKITNTNLRPIVLLSSLVVPYLKKTKGNIVNISSVAGESHLGDAGFGWSSYCTSKAGLNQFSQNCAMELAEYGIRVNIVSPGPVKTSIFETAGFDVACLENIAEKGTALRTFSLPEEVAEVIAFLASDKARTVTGSNYRIDSGFLINGRRETNFMKVN